MCIGYTEVYKIALPGTVVTMSSCNARLLRLLELQLQRLRVMHFENEYPKTIETIYRLSITNCFILILILLKLLLMPCSKYNINMTHNLTLLRVWGKVSRYELILWKYYIKRSICYFLNLFNYFLRRIENRLQEFNCFCLCCNTARFLLLLKLTFLPEGCSRFLNALI